MESKNYLKFLALKPDDFETTIVEEANIPFTEEGLSELQMRRKKAEEMGLITIIFTFRSNTAVCQII